jgi:DNA modification methylase
MFIRKNISNLFGWNTKRKFIGIEINEEYYNKAKNWIESEKTKTKFFK